MIPTREEVSNVLNNLRVFILQYGYSSIVSGEIYRGFPSTDYEIEYYIDFDTLDVNILLSYYGPTDYRVTDRLELRFTISRARLLYRNLHMTNTSPFIVPRPLTENILRQTYEHYQSESLWYLAYNTQVKPYITAKPHTLYPLIGLEWEPQLTLLNYPNRSVFIMSGEHIDNTIHLETLEKEVIFCKCVYIYLPKEYQKNIDNSNLEFRTPPVSFEELPKEIEKAQTEMENLIKAIAKELGPTGVFLPASPCSKHVNVSGVKYTTYIRMKPGEFGERYHFKVPYTFTNYSEFLDTNYRTLPIEQKSPILLGYSMTGETYIKRSDLI